MEAAGVTFETKEKQMLPGVAITWCFGWLRDRVSFLDRERITLGQSFQFYPFGSEAKEGTYLYIGLSAPLPVGERVALTVQADRQGGFPRNPAHNESIPLARLLFSYWDGAQYQPVEMIRDETFGFLFDGQIVFQVNSRMQERRIGEERGYFLRVLLKESGYEAAPCVSFMDMNTLRVQQKETVAKWLPASEIGQGNTVWGEHNLCAAGEVRVFAERQGRYKEIPVLRKESDAAVGRTRIELEQCGEDLTRADALWILAYSKEEWYMSHSVPGIGHGFPNETFGLDDDRISYEDLELLVEEAEQPGIYRKWEKREELASSGPEDMHYCLDSITGRILFGNGIHGMAPEGQVLLVSYSRVLGSRGNIKAARIHSLQSRDGEEIEVTNRWDACGGQDEETVDEALIRVRRELMRPKNPVTAQDYEELVRATPGLRIKSCKALFGADQDSKGMEQTVRIVAEPYSLKSRPKLTLAFTQNIIRHLEKKRLLGVRIKIIPPVYIKLSILVEAVVLSQYQNAEGMVEQAVREYMAIHTEKFGGSVSYSSLYGHIDRLDCVAEVRLLSLEAKDNEVGRNSYGDLIFPGNGIVDEIDIQCTCIVQG